MQNEFIYCAYINFCEDESVVDIFNKGDLVATLDEIPCTLTQGTSEFYYTLPRYYFISDNYSTDIMFSKDFDQVCKLKHGRAYYSIEYEEAENWLKSQITKILNLFSELTNKVEILQDKLSNYPDGEPDNKLNNESN